MPMSKKITAEFIGTFWLVFGGCGSAVLAAAFPSTGIGFAGVALAFGLTVVTMAYAVGHISGGHFNPAVTVGLYAGGHVPAASVAPYILAQIAGAIVAAGVLYMTPAARPASTWARDLLRTASASTRPAATRSSPAWWRSWCSPSCSCS